MKAYHARQYLILFSDLIVEERYQWRQAERDVQTGSGSLTGLAEPKVHSLHSPARV